MSARTDSGPQNGTDDMEQKADGEPHGEPGDQPDAETDEEADVDIDAEYDYADARRARWTATATGSLLTLAGLAASLMRLGRSTAPALVPAAYALGAAVCALAAFLGSRGRTRRALWLLIAGVMVMAVGDQLD